MRFIRDIIARKNQKPEDVTIKEPFPDVDMQETAEDTKHDDPSDQIDLEADIQIELDKKTAKASKSPDDTNANVSIWDIDDGSVDEAEPDDAPGADEAFASDTPAPARHRRGRVKTRILGFEHSNGVVDLFDPEAAVESAWQPKFPVGWVVIVDGPGKGEAFTLLNGLSQIGRAPDQTIPLDFGDGSISRNNHAAIAYDADQRDFLFGHGGKSNIVRLNDAPVLSTEPLKNGDVISIGETKLRFMAFCGADFDWGDVETEEETSNGKPNSRGA